MNKKSPGSAFAPAAGSHDAGEYEVYRTSGVFGFRRPDGTTCENLLDVYAQGAIEREFNALLARARAAERRANEVTELRAQ